MRFPCDESAGRLGMKLQVNLGKYKHFMHISTIHTLNTISSQCLKSLLSNATDISMFYVLTISLDKWIHTCFKNTLFGAPEEKMVECNQFQNEGWGIAENAEKCRERGDSFKSIYSDTNDLLHETAPNDLLIKISGDITKSSSWKIGLLPMIDG